MSTADRIAEALAGGALVMPALASWDGFACGFSRSPGVIPEVAMGNGATFQPFCRLGGTPSYPVTPAVLYVDVYASFLESLSRHTVGDPQNRVTLEVIRWSDDAALVLAHNSLILGGPWLGFIDPSTVPGWEVQS